MPSHDWGDDWPHWNELYKAQKWVREFFERCTGKTLHSKEKYGTIRYELTFLWLENDNDFMVFKRALQKAVIKFPNVAAEIVSDAQGLVEDDFFNGWCAGVSWVKSQSYWSSDKRPRGI
jgi:hypothetical protein